MHRLEANWTNVVRSGFRGSRSARHAAGVIVLVVLALCLATVPLAGGDLGRLADLRLRGVKALFAVLVGQVLLLAVFADGDRTLLRVGYVATFAAAAAFLLVNRRVPGVLLIGAGGAMNAVAIVANGGVMPARVGALAAAGRPITEARFRNSAAVAHPHLGWLGDTFAIPDGVPLANVFSAGDVVIVAGVLVLVHITCGSRLPRRPRAARARAT
jgi:Family of unknown function (DUF5317)